MEFNLTSLDIVNAIRRIDENPNLKKNRNSSTYDLIFENKTYPPILVLSIANQLNGGKEIKLEDFNNNIEIPFKILRDNGFEIIKKSDLPVNNKEEFKNWLTNSLSPNSGAGSSYISSIDWLSEKFYEFGKIKTKTIYEIEDITLLKKLHSETLEKQKDKASYIYNSDAPSYGDKNFYSASISKYIEFLKSKKNYLNLKFNLSDLSLPQF